VEGELWTATSEKKLAAGTEVVIIDRKGLNIYVEGVKHKRAPQTPVEE
jgi:membrane protein implicated in regulation of membrane protease activity